MNHVAVSYKFKMYGIVEFIQTFFPENFKFIIDQMKPQQR